MIGPEMQSMLHMLTPISAANIDQTFRALRGKGLIPTSPRGGAPTHLDAVHASWVLMALAIDQSPEKSAEGVTDWGAMPAADGKTVFANFGSALTAALLDEGATLAIREIRICRDWPMAEIVAGDEHATVSYRFGYLTLEAARSMGFRTSPVRSDFVLSGGAIQMIAIDIADTGERKATIV